MAFILFFLVIRFTLHLVFDFVTQTATMVKEKGDFRKSGGYLHAGSHGIATQVTLYWLLLFCSDLETAVVAGLSLAFGLLDAVTHYIIDYTKMNVGRRLGYTPADKGFWVLIGLDQWAHMMVYLSIAGLAAHQIGLG